MSALIRAPKGVPDVLPPASATFVAVRDGLLAPARLAGYGWIELPVFEDTSLFSRGVGESTDVVSKEMYTFESKGGDSLTLRPEGTAGTIRAVLEHGLAKGALPVKLRYGGPMFRYERPQAGRYRQFQQVGIEAVGSEDAALDAEVIWLAVTALQDLGLTQVRLLVNSLGTAESRGAYRSALTAFLDGLDLDDATRERAAVNPLRVLDDKRAEVQAMLVGAPSLPDFLTAEDAAHHAEVLAHLDALGVSYEEAPRLVRGLDYYSRTTFELLHDGLGAQSAVGGGGRYDGLAETLGGPRLPGIGWAIGIDRVLLALEAEGVQVEDTDSCQVFVGVATAESKPAMVGLVAQLRRLGVPAELDYDHPGRGIGKIVAAASKRGARWAVYVGAQEAEAGLVGAKDLSTGESRTFAMDSLIKEITEQ